MKTQFLSTLLLALLCTTVEAQKHPYGQNKAVGKTAQVNGISLYYEIYGQGQPLLILHGNGGYSGSRANMMDDLIAQYQVITVDHRCHGQSGCTDELNYQLMASDINQLLNHLKVDSAYIYGHSDGGILGLIMGYQYPDKVKKLVVSGANIKHDSTALEPVIVRIMKKYKQIKDPTMRKHIELMVNYPDIEFESLHGIQAPTLVLAGDRDAVRLSHTVRIFESIPKANLSIWPASTHFIGEEQPKLLTQTLLDFFKKPFRMPATTDWAKQVATQILPGVKY